MVRNGLYFCTWGNQDLTEFQRNLKYYDMLCLLPGPVRYYDVQKLFSWFHEQKKLRRSLEYAVETLGIPKDKCFHRAEEDAEYTAQIFRRLDEEEILPYFSVDVYQNPKKEKMKSIFPIRFTTSIFRGNLMIRRRS